MTFAGSGDAFGSGGRLQACIHLQPPRPQAPVLLDCGATSLPALRRCGLDPGAIAAVFVSHLHGDHFGGLPFLILDAQFAGRTAPLAVAPLSPIACRAKPCAGRTSGWPRRASSACSSSMIDRNPPNSSSGSSNPYVSFDIDGQPCLLF